MNSDFHVQFTQMIGGHEDQFFDLYWRRRVLLSKAVVPSMPYTCEDFIAEYKRENPYMESLIVTIDEQAVRRMVRPTRDWSSRGFLSNEGSLVLQAILLPRDSSSMPDVWRRFVNLHYDLCMYLLPNMPAGLQPDGAIAAVDMFYTSGETSTGGHYDTGDVFYFVLDGEKEWTLELSPDPATVLQLLNEDDDTYMTDHQPTKEHITVRVQPGDCLYVPPYTYHRVVSHGPTLAVSIGLPTYTEATLIKAISTRLQSEGRNLEPLPSFPTTRTSQFQAARQETRKRVSETLDAISRSVSELAP